MERAFDALRRFILREVNAALPLYEDGRASLPLLSERTALFGVVDPLKAAGDTLCAIYPESLEELGGQVSGEGLASVSVTVTFLCRGAPHEELLRRACRYAACFRACVAADGSLGGAARDSSAKRVNFLPDCGVADRQAAASEIEMSITFEEERKCQL